MPQKLIVCGAGVIGTNLAKYLAEEGHEVTLIEHKPGVAARATEKLDVQVTVGSAFEPQVLKDAGIARADMVIAVTNSDVANLVICSLSAAFGAKKMIARVRDTSIPTKSPPRPSSRSWKRPALVRWLILPAAGYCCVPSTFPGNRPWWGSAWAI
jgi:nucleoside-diphosphate-sugar epimerase